MSETGYLFDNSMPAGPQSRTPAPVLASRRDPQTSRDAAAYYLAGEGYETDCGRVYRGLKSHNGSTSAELARATGIDRHLCAKRLPNLETRKLVRKGEARRCNVSGSPTPAVTWWIVEQ